MIISGFICLTFEGISSFLHNKRHKALCKAVKPMSVTTDMQTNKTYTFRKHFGHVWNL